MRFLVVSLLSMLVAACAGTPPAQHSFANNVVVPASKDKVFRTATKYFAMRNIQIKTIEPVSGVIYAETNLNPGVGSLNGLNFNLAADCGSEVEAYVDSNRLVQMNVLIEEDSVDSSRITVNTTYEVSRVRNKLMGFGGQERERISCTSRGGLEGDIINFVRKAAKS